jgi:hypothetical protein
MPTSISPRRPRQEAGLTSTSTVMAAGPCGLEVEGGRKRDEREGGGGMGRSGDRVTHWQEEGGEREA